MAFEGFDVAEGSVDAGRAVVALGFALVHFMKEMLGAFVAFPVVAGAEFLVTAGKCAAVGTRVAFHVFSG